MKLINREQAVKRLTHISQTVPEPSRSAILLAALFLQNEQEFPTLDLQDIVKACESVSFETEIFQRPIKAVMLEAVRNTVKLEEGRLGSDDK